MMLQETFISEEGFTELGGIQRPFQAFLRLIFKSWFICCFGDCCSTLSCPPSPHHLTLNLQYSVARLETHITTPGFQIQVLASPLLLTFSGNKTTLEKKKMLRSNVFPLSCISPLLSSTLYKTGIEYAAVA